MRVALHLVPAVLVLGQACQYFSGESETSTSATETSASSTRPERAGPLPTEGNGSYFPGQFQSTEGTPIRYRLSLVDRGNHYLTVEADIPTEGLAAIELMMPVWTPGSYLVREYSGHLEALQAQATIPANTLNPPQVLPIAKLRKNRWRVTTRGSESVTIKYQLYSANASVRSNWVGEDRAVIVGAATFLTRPDALGRAHEVSISMPTEWKHSVTGLAPHSQGAPHHYTAKNYDVLVDSPLVLGNAELSLFEIDGVPHRLANIGGGPMWNGPESAKATEAIAREVVKFWGAIPYENYTFLNVIGQGRGGLEHLNSTLMMTSRWSQGLRDSFTSWMGLVSHEFFHTWNVKRLRPATLGPFDYESEVYTRSLWVAEGLTSYYDDLLLVRAGLLTRKEYFQRLSKTLRRVQNTEGRRVQSLEMASFDAWVKFYRGDENSKNSQISYYGKGSLVGLVLDAKIRNATAGKHSLDDVMRQAYTAYSGSVGYTPGQFEALASKVAGRDLGSFFDNAVRGTGELNYEEVLTLYGLFLGETEPAAPETDEGDAGAPESAVPKAADTLKTSEEKAKEPLAPKDPEGGYLGVGTEQSGGSPHIATVVRNGPAWRAGLEPGDELLAVNGYRLTGGLSQRLKHYLPEHTIEVLISRRGRLQSVSVTLGNAPKESEWQLQKLDKPSAAQALALDAWLGRAPLVALK